MFNPRLHMLPQSSVAWVDLVGPGLDGTNIDPHRGFHRQAVAPVP
jgi:hypothetical protein